MCSCSPVWLEYLEGYLENVFPVFLRKKPWDHKDDLCVIGASYLSDATGDLRWERYIRDSSRWLLKEDGRKGSEILDGIRDTYLRREEDGYHLYGICASAGLGVGPGPHNRKDRTGKPGYYVREAQMADNQHGAAACMMAVSEQVRR